MRVYFDMVLDKDCVVFVTLTGEKSFVDSAKYGVKELKTRSLSPCHLTMFIIDALFQVPL